MAGTAPVRSSLPDLPSKYWSTLTHHGHLPPAQFNLEDEFERLSGIHIDTHDPAYFSDFAYNKTVVSVSTRTCSSLLSEMLRPSAASRTTSPATTHVEGLSDHGSYSTHSTPPLQSTPPKHAELVLTTSILPKRPLCSVMPACEPHRLTNDGKVVRHISFGGVTTAPPKKSITVDTARTINGVAEDESNKDYSGEATPTVKGNLALRHPSAEPRLREPLSRKSSGHSEQLSTDDQSVAVIRPRAIRFGNSTTPSVASSRRSSLNESSHCDISEEGNRSRSSQVSTNNSPTGCSRAGVATCKSTLESVLKKEAIAKVIETVPEEEDEDDEAFHGDQDASDRDNDESGSEDEDDFDDSNSILELDSDDDGYQEDIESDDDLLDEDVYPPVLAESGTPTIAARLFMSSRNNSNDRFVSTKITSSVIHRTAVPSESDLPDTTDFAPGNMDEDQAACIAFDVAIKDRNARRRPAKPSDIDPTFPASGSEDESAEESTRKSPEVLKTGRTICRSPPMQRKSACHQRWNSPPLAKQVDLCRAKSLPRRYRKGIYEPKPQRAVTIKQSNEQRAQRRREKTELRHNLRRGKQEVDHNGHEKMKVHCLSRKRLIAAENPCVFRPIMSI